MGGGVSYMQKRPKMINGLMNQKVKSGYPAMDQIGQMSRYSIGWSDQ
jgi:hypothetical protein